MGVSMGVLRMVDLWSADVTTESIDAVLFDFGGVILSSPFEAFNHFEASQGIAPDFIRTINSTNPDDNAWAKFERRDISAAEFGSAFALESKAAGYEIDGAVILELIHGEVRPEMVEAVRRVKAAGFKTSCLTNNFRSWTEAGVVDNPRDLAVHEALTLFDHVVESSVIGVRKPELGFYERALEIVGVAADRAVFLDDLGINLKPAKAMGMTTIKVLSADQALTDLDAVLGLDLRGQV